MLHRVGTLVNSFELEIIACSLEDARAAWQGGAARLEVTVSLDQGGLTPPLRLVEQIVREIPIPSRVMLREKAEFILGDGDLATLKRRAREFATIGVEGFVTGYVGDGSLDLEALTAVIQAARSMRVTVHNAIEQTNDPLKALADLRAFPNVDRALVRAGVTVEERVQRLPAYAQAFGQGRDLILGGDLRLDMLQPLRRETDIHIFHLGRAVRTPETPAGAVDADKVRNAVRLLSEEIGGAYDERANH